MIYKKIMTFMLLLRTTKSILTQVYYENNDNKPLLLIKFKVRDKSIAFLAKRYRYSIRAQTSFLSRHHLPSNLDKKKDSLLLNTFIELKRGINQKKVTTDKVMKKLT